MSENATREVYQFDLHGVTCRSGEKLVVFSIREIPDVESVNVTEDGRVLVVPIHGHDIQDSLVAAVVAAGFYPENLRVSRIESGGEVAPLSIEDARRVGLVAPPKTPVRAKLEQIQCITVNVTDGYDPDTIIVAEGIPIDIEFSEGHGCLGRVVFESLGVDVDLEDGGAIVRLPALEPGIHPFRCGRDMVHGTLIVE